MKGESTLAVEAVVADRAAAGTIAAVAETADAAVVAAAVEAADAIAVVGSAAVVVEEVGKAEEAAA